VVIQAQEIPLDEYERKFKHTHPGMAHLAGTGPAGKTCRECEHFLSDGHYAKSGKHGGALKPGQCCMYTSLMRAKGPNVPHYALACRHFGPVVGAPQEPSAR